MPHSAPPAAIIGCDVGKHDITVHQSHTGTTQVVPNTLDALERFLTGVEADCLVVCESTGGYETALLQAALLTGRPAHRADARKVKAFIRSFGTLGKTDALDAKALARYGAERHATLARWQAPDASRDRLQALVLTRQDLVVERQGHRNRVMAPKAAPVARHLRAVIACLSDQIAALEADIAALITADPALNSAVAALQTIGGIGKATAPALLALMPELGSLTGRQAAALAGLAPHPNQSGQANGYRRTRGGRPHVRSTLFMAALVAARRNPALHAFSERLRQAGKKPIVALTAVMRKLIVIANAVLRDTARNNAAKISTQVS